MIHWYLRWGIYPWGLAHSQTSSEGAPLVLWCLWGLSGYLVLTFCEISLAYYTKRTHSSDEILTSDDPLAPSMRNLPFGLGTFSNLLRRGTIGAVVPWGLVRLSGSCLPLSHSCSSRSVASSRWPRVPRCTASSSSRARALCWSATGMVSTPLALAHAFRSLEWGMESSMLSWSGHARANSNQ